MKGYDLLAPFYSFLAEGFIGKKTYQNVISYQLEHFDNVDYILILGGGSGKVLKSIAKNNFKQCDYVDTSNKMIGLAQKQWKQQNIGIGNVSWISNPNYIYESSNKYDLIICQFYLDLFTITELNAILESIKEKITDKGQLIVADFEYLENPSILNRFKFFILLKFFRVVTKHPNKEITPIRAKTKQAGFYEKKIKLFSNNLIFHSIFKKNKF